MRHLLRLATFAFSAILLSFPALCPAQNHIYDQWCFGLEMGLDFRSGSPRLFRPQIRAIEGGASICDANTGALLFYTDGVTVWNRNHQVMSNGTGLMGHLSTTQSSLIVPHPADPDLYYLFTADAGPYGLRLAGIHYSIVDMRGDGGLGTVGQKNIPLLKEATEKLVGIYHCDANSIFDPSVIFFAPRRSRLWKVFFGIGMWSVSRKQGLLSNACSRIDVPFLSIMKS